MCRIAEEFKSGSSCLQSLWFHKIPLTISFTQVGSAKTSNVYSGTLGRRDSMVTCRLSEVWRRGGWERGSGIPVVYVCLVMEKGEIVGKTPILAAHTLLELVGCCHGEMMRMAKEWRGVGALRNSA